MSLGETLRKAREERGLSVADVAQSTRLLSRQISAIENEDFSGITAAIYGKGFIKLYAECVGVDPAPLCAEFTEIYNGSRPPVIARRTIPQTSPVQRPVVRTIQRQPVQETPAPVPPSPAPVEKPVANAQDESARTEPAAITQPAPAAQGDQTATLGEAAPSLGELFDAAARTQAASAPATRVATPSLRQHGPVTQPATTVRPAAAPQPPVRRRIPSGAPQQTPAPASQPAAAPQQRRPAWNPQKATPADATRENAPREPFLPARLLSNKWAVAGLCALIAVLVVVGAIVSSNVRTSPAQAQQGSQGVGAADQAMPSNVPDSAMIPPGLNERVVPPPSPYME